MVAYTKHDLQFILDGIVVSEAHALQTNTVDLTAGTWTVADLETSRQILLDLIPNSLEPIGMRTISGELNNLVINQGEFGATGEFPRLLDPNFINEVDDAMAFGPPIIDITTGSPISIPGVNGGTTGVPLGYIPGPGGNWLNNNDYGIADPNSSPNPREIQPGDVVDADPRIISNLIVDQTINNPVALNAALNLAGVEDVATASEQITLAFEALDLADQTTVDAYNAVLDAWGVTADTDGLLLIENTAPDEGLSAPFNSWMTLFGQFFDHGLDLVAKGGNGTVYIPLEPDDPLYVEGSNTNFMVVTRATLNENGEATNFTSPFVDQNQTYTSHPSHQIFVREYEADASGRPLSTGNLIENRDISSAATWDAMTDLGGMATWGAVKAQARDLLGIELTDAEAVDIPLFAVDQYGDFLAGADGLPQFVIQLDDGLGAVDSITTTLVEGNLADPVSLADAVAIAQAEAPAGTTASAITTGFAFLADIAHNANPIGDHDADPDTADALLTPDADTTAGGVGTPPPAAGEYDNELLDAHFIAGDGRANENFGLTAVHHVFHQEHNRLVDHTKARLLDGANTTDLGTVGDLDGTAAALELLNGYLLTDLTEAQELALATLNDGDPTEEALLAFAETLDWNGSRLFQAAKFGTEMQYQHLVFEEFARKVQPLVDIFASYETSIDASIVAEFAHTVYRFGHSMLTETVDLMDEEGNLTEAGLIEAFLNPIGFHQLVQADGTVAAGDLAAQDSEQAAAAIARAMTRQEGSEIDEFVTEALRNNLLGLPLDLAAINIGRGRETGIPSLNEARAQFYEGTGDTKLQPYENWLDFALNLKNGGASIVNFIAAYGDHDALLAADVDTLEERRDVALALTIGGSATINAGTPDERVFTADDADRLDFLNAEGIYAGGTLGGLNRVDFWIGGLAEATEPFGGMLGSTFNFVFEQQLEDLQDGDRFYYLGRTGGLNFLSQLEQNSFANMIIRNTTIGDTGADHLPGDIFSTPTWILEVDQSRQVTGFNPDGTPIRDDPTDGGELNPFLNTGGNTLVIRDNPNTAGPDTNYLRYTGGDHVVLGGTNPGELSPTNNGNDILIGGLGDDTIWGDGGDDYIQGGDGGDILLGGEGDDILLDIGGPNNIQGQEGNDAISAGGGEALILGGSGQDFVLQGPDFAETFGGLDNDFINAGTESNIVFGNEGNDWLEGGGGNNLLVGDNGDPFLNSTAGGHDVFISGLGDDDYDSEGGDDIMEGADGIQRFEGLNGFDWATYQHVDEGVNADMLLRAFDETPIPPSNVSIMDRFDSVEGLSGGRGNDILRGSNQTDIEITALNNGNNSVLEGEDRFSLIRGLREGDNGGEYDASDASDLYNPIFTQATTSYGEGDIILGGAGSDLIEGRAGNDIIDGDMKLQVRLLAEDGSGNLATAFSMEGQLYQVEADGTLVLGADGAPVATQLGGFDNLDDAVFNRVVNPGNIEIWREIIDERQPGNTDFDTVEFAGNRADYLIEADTDGNIGDQDGDGFIEVQDIVGTDGTDLLRGIERLAFADEVINLAGGNSAAAGEPAIHDTVSGLLATTIEVGQQLTANIDNVTDGDGIPENPIVSYTWQFEEEPGSGAFADFEIINGSGEVGPLEGETITVPPEADGFALRVVARFRDSNGVLETVASSATQPIAPDVPGVTLNGGPGAQTLIGGLGPDLINGNGGTDTIIGDAGNDELNGGPGADNIDGGAGNDMITGGGGADTITGDLGNDSISGGGAADTIDGGDGNDTINGNGGADIIAGGAGDDTINGGNGADTISGDEGDDTIIAGGGNDVIEWRARDAGRDFIDGGGNGNAGDTFDIRTNGDGDTVRILTTAAFLADPASAGETLAGGTEIVITYADPINGVAESVVAELQNIEELVINAIEEPPAGVDGDGTNIVIIGDFDATSLNLDTITINGSSANDTVDITGLTSAHRVVFNTNGGNDMIVGDPRPQDVINGSVGDGTSGGAGGQQFALTQSDLSELLNLVRGLPSDLAEDHATGIRDLEGTGNNLANPDFGSADQPFIRLTEARYGEKDEATGNRGINPIFDGLEPREISNILGTQESDLPTSAEDANTFFMAFGQYFDHGLDFLPKGGNGTIAIDGVDVHGGPPGSGNFADLTRGSVDHIDANGVPQHINQASPFVDQNQTYGSTELVGQFLREGDGNGGLGSKMLAGGPDPSNPDYSLLPTLRELILHHWENDTEFSDPVHMPAGPMSFREYFTDLPYTNGAGDAVTGTLVDANGDINEDMVPFINGDFMGSGYTIVGDANPFVSLLDHYVSGDLRANENFALTAIHTIWARNHNYHVENLEAAGFAGNAEELFQAAKILNESEYQRVVFDEFADQLLGGLKGSGSHGFDDYNPAVDARVSHEFAAAAYRFGHSLISQTFTVIDENGQPTQVPLTDAFLNPTNDADAFDQPLPPGYNPQPGYEQRGVNGVVEGIAGQPAEEVDFNVVDAVRDDLVRIRADLFSFNVARGWDVGLGTLNQVRADLMKSNDTYVSEAIDLSGEDLSPYSSWEDFGNRNGLSPAILAQFMAAYPDLVLQTPDEISAFQDANPDIELTGADNNVVRGIDRVDFWVGGLAEEHINGGMVGATFWVVLHEQFDRLQEGDRFYYIDRVEDFDFYQQVEDQTFSDIIERNTGLEGLPEDIFTTDAERVDDDTDSDTDGDNAGDDADSGDSSGDDGNDDQSAGDDSGSGGSGSGSDSGNSVDAPMTIVGGVGAETLIGGSSADMIAGNGADDTLLSGSGDDTVAGGTGADIIVGGEGDDVLIGNDGDDTIVGDEGNDFILGGDGNDHIIAGDGNDWVNAGTGRDVVDLGAGDDTVVASWGDWGDVYRGGEGVDTYDTAAVTSDTTVDLGVGVASSSQSGVDMISDFENVITGAGNDTIIANSSANVMTGGAGDDTFVFNSVADADGTHITDFAPGDTIDLSGIAANYNFAGDGSFDLLGEGATFSQAGQLIVRTDGDDLIVEGNVDNNNDADFAIRVSGKPNLDPSDFNGV